MVRRASRRAAAAVSGLVVTQGRPSCLGASVRCNLSIFVFYNFLVLRLLQVRWTPASTSLQVVDVVKMKGANKGFGKAKVAPWVSSAEKEVLYDSQGNEVRAYRTGLSCGR